jgi:hypothetical protein
MAANTFCNNTRKTPMAKYIHSTIQCRVVLDRLDQANIDQIMENSIEDNQRKIATTVCIFIFSNDVKFLIYNFHSQKTNDHYVIYLKVNNLLYLKIDVH